MSYIVWRWSAVDDSFQLETTLDAMSMKEMRASDLDVHRPTLKTTAAAAANSSPQACAPLSQFSDDNSGAWD